MTYKELANILKKKPATIAVFFSRHNLSIKSTSDISFYLKHLSTGKRLESGKRKAEHLKAYRFKPQGDSLDKARELVKARGLVWYANPKKLSKNSIVEHVLSNGTFEDFKELVRILGKRSVKEIFSEQVKKSRTNYRPITLNFFKHYFSIV